MNLYSDPTGQLLHALDQAVGLDLQKLAEQIDPAEQLPVTSYADPLNRLYPIHTKEATLLSTAYATHRQVDPVVAGRLAEAATFWGCEAEAKKVAAELKAFRRGPKYALDQQIGDQQVCAWPYWDGPSVGAAVNSFLSDRAKLPYEVRAKVARQLLSDGHRMGAKLTDGQVERLEQTLGWAVPSHERACQMLLSRSRMTSKRSGLSEGRQKLAQVVDQLIDRADVGVGQLAVRAFAAFDEQSGLAAKYARSELSLPEDQLFPLSRQKMAQVVGHLVELKNGLTVDLRTIDWSKIAEIDPQLYEACQNGDPKVAREVLPTWPLGDIQLVVDLADLKAAG